MRKLDKRDYLNILIIIASFFVLFFVMILKRKGIYGSKMDFSSQHYLIPEYFRNLFYETKDIFPSYAFNLGMGQNIYNFSYYGLFNPIILISYLFPFIKMVNYITISSILLLLLSVVLFYKFISKYTSNKNIRFVVSFLFLLASPLIFHTHRHIMFVNYVPFVLMGLFGVENYIEKNKKVLLILSTFLIIITSYFFSIPSIIVLLIYGIFLFIKNDNNISTKKLFIKTFKLGLLFIIPILMSSILILPTFFSILNSRFEEKGIEIIKMFIPDFSFNNVLYGHYTLGLTSIFIFSLAHFLIKKQKEYKFLSITFLTITFFPIISYILNGFMYINGKVFIPFIPLALLLITQFLENLSNKKYNIKKTVLLSLIISVLGCINFDFHVLNSTIMIYFIDFLIVYLVMNLLVKQNISNTIYILLIFPIILSLIVNLSDKLESKDVILNQYDKNIKEEIIKINKQDPNLYRTIDNSGGFQNSNNIRDIKEYKNTMYSSLTNKNYKSFNWYDFNKENPYRNDAIYSDSNNILYNIYTGGKYYVSQQDENLLGYEKIDNNLYENNDVFSLGYVNNKYMSEKQYNSLNYPYNVEARLNYTIIDDDSIVSNYKSNLKEIPLEKTNYDITNKKKRKFKIKTKDLYKNKVLFIKFNMDYVEKCKVGDTYIKINDITNTLTCKGWKYHNKNYTFEYVIGDKEIKDLNITMSKGKFKITNIKAYILDYNYVKSINGNHKDLLINKKTTKGDIINGNINSNSGYLTLSIPYDKGYRIYIDGKESKVEKVNKNFIGTKIDKGNHDIKILYKAPLLKEGKVLSLLGVLILLIMLVVDWKKGCKHEKNINGNTMLQ